MLVCPPEITDGLRTQSVVSMNPFTGRISTEHLRWLRHSDRTASSHYWLQLAGSKYVFFSMGQRCEAVVWARNPADLKQTLWTKTTRFRPPFGDRERRWMYTFLDCLSGNKLKYIQVLISYVVDLDKFDQYQDIHPFLWRFGIARNRKWNNFFWLMMAASHGQCALWIYYWHPIQAKTAGFNVLSSVAIGGKLEFLKIWEDGQYCINLGSIVGSVIIAKYLEKELRLGLHKEICTVEAIYIMARAVSAGALLIHWSHVYISI